jgi:hypothetical protein
MRPLHELPNVMNPMAAITAKMAMDAPKLVETTL